MFTFVRGVSPRTMVVVVLVLWMDVEAREYHVDDCV